MDHNVKYTVQRYALFALIATLIFLLLREWTAFSSAYDKRLEQSQQSSSNLHDLDAKHGTNIPSGITGDDSATVPSGSDDLPLDLATSDKATAPDQQAISAAIISVTTDKLIIKINPRGGRIEQVEMLDHLTEQADTGVPLKLLESSSNRYYTAIDGLVYRDRTRTENLLFKSTDSSYDFTGQEGASLTLSAIDAKGNKITKRYRFPANDYVIQSEITIANRGQEPWYGRYHGEIVRDNSEDPGSDDAPMGMRPFLGVATTTPDTPYEKISLRDIAKENYEQRVEGGSWIAMIQHYFVSAWIPNQDTAQTIYTRQRQFQQKGINVIGFIGADHTVEPGSTHTFSATFYAGPKDQYRLGQLSENLDLTLDYGFLWWLSQPLYALLHMFATGELHIFGKVIDVFSGFQNWGLAIIALTFVVKAIFYKLSAASYRSMANMRRVQPKLLALRERYASDKQAQSKAMMELYQKEKINPLGGCLPILIQMPVFIALYWALIESVELRHAPFALWITDLSVMDPYFILPIIMGATMWFQTKMNPTPPDPMQAKIMQWMPIIFTFFFLWFPAGLVVYWVTNNILSIAQQWYITKKIEQENATSS